MVKLNKGNGLFKLSAVKIKYSLNHLINNKSFEEQKSYIKNIKLLNYRIFYKNDEYNRYDIKSYGFYKNIPYKKRYKKLKIKFGTIIFFKNFPLIDTLSGEETPSFKNHYFAVIGIDNKNDKIYLSYITTKIERYTSSKKRNNNYIRIRDLNTEKNILISTRKIFEIDKDYLFNELQNKLALINKELKPELVNYLKKVVLNSEHLSNEFKSYTKKYLNIFRDKIKYSLKTELNERSEKEKEQIFKEIKNGKFINLISNY